MKPVDTCVLLVALGLSAASFLAAQQPVSDPQAVAFAARAAAALTGGSSVTDATLTATVNRTAGSLAESGTATLKASANGLSRMDLALPSGSISESRDYSTEVPTGAWSGADAAIHRMKQHNSWTDAVWFFPAFSSLAQFANPSVIFSYIGAETREGQSVQRIRCYRYFAAQEASTTSNIRRMSTMDFVLDSTTLLPVAMVFNAHPDGDETADIAVEIRFSDYRASSGVLVSFHIQRFINNCLSLDLTITSAALNSALQPNEFVLR